jgi:poly(A) polymerase
MRLFDRAPGPWIKLVKEHLRELVIEGTLAPDDRDGAAGIAKTLLDNDESGLDAASLPPSGARMGASR